MVGGMVDVRAATGRATDVAIETGIRELHDERIGQAAARQGRQHSQNPNRSITSASVA
jgi:hypothetical protein